MKILISALAIILQIVNFQPAIGETIAKPKDRSETIAAASLILKDVCLDYSKSTTLTQSALNILAKNDFNKIGGGFGSKATIFEKNLANGDEIWLSVGRDIYYEPNRCKLLLIGENMREIVSDINNNFSASDLDFEKNGFASNGINEATFYTKEIERDKASASVKVFVEKFESKNDRISIVWDLNLPPSPDRDSFNMVNLLKENCIKMPAINNSEFIAKYSPNFDEVLQLDDGKLKIQNKKKYPRVNIAINPATKTCEVIFIQKSNANDMALDDLISALTSDSRLKKSILREKVDLLGYVIPTEASRIFEFSYRADGETKPNEEGGFVIKYYEYGIAKIFVFGEPKKQ